MKIYFSPASPFVRKCMIVAHELGLESRIEKLPSAAHPVNRDTAVIAANPLGQVPTLITDDGLALFDSRVVCEYLNDLAGGSLFPREGDRKWRALADQSLADGILDAALLTRYEGAVRPQEFRWTKWTDGQMGKVRDGLAHFEKTIGERGKAFDIGTITLVCALGYLDFRFAECDWRGACPAVAAWYAAIGNRPSVAGTVPQA